MTATRVLVTGASGFVGRWSLGPLLARGAEVHAVQRHAPPAMPRTSCRTRSICTIARRSSR